MSSHRARSVGLTQASLATRWIAAGAVGAVALVGGAFAWPQISAKAAADAPAAPTSAGVADQQIGTSGSRSSGAVAPAPGPGRRRGRVVSGAS